MKQQAWLANTKGTDVTLSRGSLHRLVRCVAGHGEPVAIETHVHLLSDHVTAALAAGWRLAELREQVIDDRWVKMKPSWTTYRDVPISFACVWRR